MFLFSSLDEGHHMKDTQSKLTQTLTTYYHSRYRIILTGTPLSSASSDTVLAARHEFRMHLDYVLALKIEDKLVSDSVFVC
jgi:SNF2-related domain